MPEAVNHPQHYGGADNLYEHIKVCDAWELDYRLGNCTKYICRAGKKGDNALEDLKKAAWYLNDAINRLEEARPKAPPGGRVQSVVEAVRAARTWADCPPVDVSEPTKAVHDG